jgi:hypothetical protein
VDQPANKLARSSLILAAAVLLLMVMSRAATSWRTDANLDHVAGVWIALAADVKDGVFYRPLFGERGYGGTRYFPLEFVLHGELLKLGGDPEITGYALSLLETLALLAGVYFLLRRLGVDTFLAGCSAGCVLAANSAQYGLLTIRGDLLPAALNVWGLVILSGPALSFPLIGLAALLFTLAFSAKVTTVFGLAVIFLYFRLSGSSKRAWHLLGLTACGFAAVLGVMYLASHGRVFEIMRACATGGATFADVWSSPVRLLYQAMTQDAGILSYLVLGCAALLATPVKAWVEIPPLLFLATAATTLGIFFSPGTNYNHFVDVQVASIVMLATWLARAERQNASFGVAGLAAATLIASMLAYFSLTQDRMPRRFLFNRALELIGNAQGPILAEHPLLPILAGQHPYLLDPFLFRILSEHDPSFAEPLWKKLEEKQFSAIVLQDDPRTVRGQRWYNFFHLGPEFIRRLNENYELVAALGGQYIYGGDFVYLPRRGEPAPAGTGTDHSAVPPSQAPAH